MPLASHLRARPPHYSFNPVLSPGTTHRVWTTAIQALISVLGQDAVLFDSAVSDYITPYDLREAESATDKRKVPSVTSALASRTS
ncbi:hypothetical protein GE21DRAFT_1279197 [Neurospora crassa]|nr:hypothetical protein GE21DRAFT_1279197 [Neurospora crassa]